MTRSMSTTNQDLFTDTLALVAKRLLSPPEYFVDPGDWEIPAWNTGKIEL